MNDNFEAGGLTVGLIVGFVIGFCVCGLIRPASAQDYVMPKIPTEAEKIEALKLAYRLNGNSMVGPTIDLTDPRMNIKPVATVPITPDEKPVAEKPRQQVADLCARHGKRKVVRGNSWRCR